MEGGDPHRSARLATRSDPIVSPGCSTTIVVNVHVRNRGRLTVVPASAAAASMRVQARSSPSAPGGTDITRPSPWRTASAIARGPKPET